MVNGIRNALLFGGGALVAALAVAYGLGAFAPAPAERVAETAPTENAMTAKEGRVPSTGQKPGASSSAADQSGVGQPATKDAMASAGNPLSDAPSSAPEGGQTGDATTGAVTAPAFDVVRAEGDGSIVIAGRAAPGAKVEVLSGSNVLGTAKTGGEGDFAIVVDDPLKPGDYQLVLRSTTPANVVAMSKETAVVSIPEHENGQVLALVEAPGQPSKLITVPKAVNGAAPAPAAPGAAQPATGHGSATAPGSTASAQQPAGAGAPSGGATASSPALTGTGQGMASAGGQTSSKGSAAGNAQSSNGGTAASSNDGQPAQPQVSVEAVEIEGNKVFVAGVAVPGSTVRVYANDAVLGEAKTSPVGRFLVEAIHELAVGDYIIRADMLTPDGLKVAARAAVPFTRAAGESVSAVASGEAGAGGTRNGSTMSPTDEKAANGADVGSASGGAATGSSGGAPNAVGTEGASGAVASNEPGSTVLPSLDSSISRQPPTIVAPKLRETRDAVIIRRGDTLWQISRRVYGHGVRYSTIYLANQDQIENPDLIWPGQIFAVPNETDKGETADMKAIAGQSTELPKKAVE